ncbi:MAG: flagellin FliC5 [Lachnospiraceae bacterium]|nr:flagellin FliC5 [Lachnospiraceae bacterium]MDE7436162.1 flagellin FliC5 [Lachnospiraceae bacterium]
MSSISGVSASSYADYGKIASGKRVQTSADGAAELSIIEKEDAQARGYDAGANNIGSAQDMLRVADGALDGITDHLQRIRELAVQASNTAVLSDSDRASIQKEVDQLKQGIADIAANTAFNTKNLLDGSNMEFRFATDGNGASVTVNTGNATLEALGIADFDVTGDFDITDIDEALSIVTSQRSSAGAQSNALEHAYNYTTGAALNTRASKSRLEDLDIPEAISELKKKQTLEQYKLMMQKKQMEHNVNRMRNMFT